MDEKISKIDAFIQIGDLETLRNQLIQLVDQKMGAIEKRIESTKLVAEPLIAEMLNRAPAQKIPTRATDEKAKVPDISDLLRAETSPAVSTADQPALPKIEPISPAQIQNFSSRKSGEKVEELQKELLEALDRLEKLDVET